MSKLRRNLKLEVGGMSGILPHYDARDNPPLSGRDISRYVSVPIVRDENFRGGNAIILLGGDGSVGHWVCVVNGEYWDSYGQKPPKWIKMPYSRRTYQSDRSVDCGKFAVLRMRNCHLNNEQFNKMFDVLIESSNMSPNVLIDRIVN